MDARGWLETGMSRRKVDYFLMLRSLRPEITGRWVLLCNVWQVLRVLAQRD
jgi:hypothetical protein